MIVKRNLSKAEQSLQNTLRSQIDEGICEKELSDYFGELFVHTQGRRISSNGSIHNYDFIIYASKKTFGIDVFFSKDIDNLRSYLYRKIKPYTNFKQKTYILSLNNSLDKNLTDPIFKRYSTKYITCMNYDEFLQNEMIKYTPLTVPKDFREWYLSDIERTENILKLLSKKHKNT